MSFVLLRRLVLVWALFASWPLLQAQSNKPKVALVLSGGGAKGLAHIPLLQTLDSLGIVPDLVIGTSMGSVVGGLYALGYSGDSIAHISSTADWSQLLGGNIQLGDVGIEEKSEFKRYTVELDLKGKSLKTPQSLIGDQNLKEYLSLLCFPSHEITEFDQLPIPFRAVAVDIVKGRQVVLDSGRLYRAMRASMAIPSVFKPLEYKETLLVDGGVLNNFPTDVAKEWGADIIIGSDVGGGMSSREELEDIITLLFQAGMLQSNLKNPENRALCDILLDHTENLSYGTADFLQAKSIIKQGNIATRDAIPALVALSNDVKQYDQRVRQFPNYSQSMVFDTIAYAGIDQANLGLVAARLDLQADSTYETGHLQAAMRRALGTTLFTELDYLRFTNGQSDDGLLIKGNEKSPSRVKSSLHYDTERGVGIILNMTFRNLIGKSSRSLLSVDIAESPRLRLQHQKYLGVNKKWWLRFDGYGEQVTQGLYLQGQSVDGFRYRFVQLQNQINYSLGASFVGAAVNYEYTQSKPKVDPDVSDNIISLEQYAFHNLEINARYLANTQDKVFFPTKGRYLRILVARTLTNNLLIERSVDSLQNLDGSIENFTRLSVEYEARLPVNEKLTALIDVRLGYSLVDNKDQNFVDFGYGAFGLLGGVQPRPRREKHIFPGLRDGELAVPQFSMIRGGFQYNIFSQFYATPHIEFALVGNGFITDYFEGFFDPSWKWEQFNDTAAVFSGGLSLGYNTFIGPFFLDVSRVSRVSSFRFTFGFGYHFNRSD